jgi:hypothetical protein
MTVLGVADALKVGSSDVDRVYLGSSLVWPLSVDAPSYAEEVLADVPLGYWRLDETSGTVMADSSGNGRNGAYNGSGLVLASAGLLVADPADKAVEFPGSNGAYGVVSHAAWQDAGSFTVEAWVKPNAVTGNPTIASRYGDTFSMSRFILRLDGDKPAFYTFSGGTLASAASATAVAVGQVYHLAGTYNASTGAMVLYVNGVQVATATRAGVNTGTIPLTIGARYSDGTAGNGRDVFNGRIDEVAYYGTALTADRVMAHYVAGLAADAYGREVLKDAPWGFWRLNEAALRNALPSTGSDTQAWALQGGQGEPAAGLYGDGGRALTAVGGADVLRRTGVPASLLGNNVTIAGWVRIPAGGGKGSFMLIGSGGDGWGVGVGLNDWTVAGWKLIVLAGGSAWLPSTYSFPAAGVYHVAVTRTSTTLFTIYVNGTQVATVNAGSVLQPSTSMYLGSTAPNAGMQYDGWAAFATALSAARIGAHYAGGAGSNAEVAADAPVVWLRLDETHELHARDTTPARRDLIVLNADVPETGLPSPAGGKAVRFDTSAAGLRNTVTAAQPTTTTFEAWVRIDELPSTVGVSTGTKVFEWGGAGSNGTTSALVIRSDGRVGFDGYFSGSVQVTAANPLTLGEWHHVVASVGAAGVKIRVDGVTVATAGNTSVQSVASGHLLVRAAGPASATGYGPVKLAGLAVWRSQLSDARTDAHYLAGIGA